MSEHLWGSRPRPVLGPDAFTVGRWGPATLVDLTAGRRQLAAALREEARPPGSDEGAVERLLLVFEELASNALRHGGGPVVVSLTDAGDCWLLEVSDAAIDRPPTPAVGRDAAQGGLGLHLVARISAEHGWSVEGDRKVAWARLDHSRADVPSAPVPLPSPRKPLAGDSHTH